MKKIIETQAELENKLSEICGAAQNAQAGKEFFYDSFFVVSSLVPSLPSLGHDQYGFGPTSSSPDSPLFRGFDTVVVANIECMADFSQSARRTLTFERKGRDIRCFYADGLYLYYPYVYHEKTHSLSTLAYGDLCRKYGAGQRPVLTEPNRM